MLRAIENKKFDQTAEDVFLGTRESQIETKQFASSEKLWFFVTWDKSSWISSSKSRLDLEVDLKKVTSSLQHLLASSSSSTCLQDGGNKKCFGEKKLLKVCTWQQFPLGTVTIRDDFYIFFKKFVLGNNFQLHFRFSFGDFLQCGFQLLPAFHPEKSLQLEKFFDMSILCERLFETNWERKGTKG